MRIQTHIFLNRFFQVYRLVSPFAVLVMYFSTPLAIALIIIIYIILWAFASTSHVRCSTTPGCNGRMQVTSERSSFWSVTYHYECDTCHALEEEKIFNPNFEVSAEFS